MGLAPPSERIHYIYIGNAEYEGEEASKIQASYNKGIIQAGVTAESTVYGGRAYYKGPVQNDMAVEADGNTLVLQKGSNAWCIYGADAYDPTDQTGSVSARNNTVVVEGGNTLSATRIYGAYASSNGYKIASTSVASGNTVTINEGVTLERAAVISAGTASDSSVVASGNKLYMYKPAASKIFSLWAGNAKGFGGNCTASNNICELVLGDTEVVTPRYSGAGEAWNPYLYHCDTEANSNTLHVTGGVFAGNLFSGLAYGYGSETYSENTFVADGNTAKLDGVVISKSFSCGYAGFGGVMQKLSASKNIAFITDTAAQTLYGGCVSGGKTLFYDNGVFSNLSEASENELTISDSKVVDFYGGYSFSYESAVASGNKLVKIDNTTIAKDIYGAYAGGTSAQASGNTGTLENVTFVNDETGTYPEDGLFIGGMADAYLTVGKDAEAVASSNKFEINGGALVTVCGGYAKAENGGYATANGNELVLTGTTVHKVLYAGRAETSATAVEQEGGTSGNAEASANKLVLSGGTYEDNIYGGSAYVDGDQSMAEAASVATAESNELALTDVQVMKDIVGGSAVTFVDTEKYSDAVSGDAAAKKNKLALSGGSYGGNIYGGFASVTNSAAEASKNMVYLNCTADASGAVSLSDSSSDISGSIYGSYTAGITAEASGNYGALNKVQAEKGLFSGGCAEGYGGETTASDNAFAITESTLASIYGGLALSEKGSAVTADGNKLALTKVTVSKDLYGGCAETAAAAGGEPGSAGAKSNTLALYGGSYVNIYAGYASAGGSTAEASENLLYVNCTADASGEVSLSDSSSEISGSIYGGYAAGSTADASGNRGALNKVSAGNSVFFGGSAEGAGGEAKASDNIFAITDSSLDSVYGGQAISGQGSKVAADSNELVLTNVTVSKDVYAGFAETAAAAGEETGASSATSNTLSLYGGTYGGGNIFAGFASASGSAAYASSNMLYVNCTADASGEVSLSDTSSDISGNIYGGCANGSTADASGNYGALNKVSADNSVFLGGSAEGASGAAKASENIFAITDSSLAGIYGGQAISKQGSKVTADGNELVLTNVTVSKDLYAGFAETVAAAGEETGAASAKSNTLSLYGGTYGGSIYGGYAAGTTADAGGNAVRLFGLNGTSPSFDASATVIWGGRALAGDAAGTSSGNTLVVSDAKGMTAANIMNFQNIAFFFTEPLVASDVILELKGSGEQKTTTIAGGGKIVVSIDSVTGQSGKVFRTGDKVILLKNDNGLDIRTAAENIILNKDVISTAGASLKCRLSLAKDASSLYLTGTDFLDSGSKSIAEGALSGLALVGESATAAAEALDNMAAQADQGIISFGSAHASSMTYESGSSIHVSSVSLIAGIGSGIAFDAGRLNVGAFFEYGKGSYTTHNDFSDRSDVDGDGASWYMGGGILARMTFKDTGPGHFYVEGSAHMGSVHNEFDSNGFSDGYGNAASFDMDSPYYSLHGGLGYVWNMAEGHELNLYGKYLWTMVQGTDVTLSTADKYDFDDMHSNRIRAGVRYSYTGSERFKPYVGVAYEHEFSGSCDARAYGLDVNSPSYQGGTGTGELGIAMMPAESLPLSFNLGVQGSVGKRRGVSGNCNIMYEF